MLAAPTCLPSLLDEAAQRLYSNPDYSGAVRDITDRDAQQAAQQIARARLGQYSEYEGVGTLWVRTIRPEYAHIDRWQDSGNPSGLSAVEITIVEAASMDRGAGELLAYLDGASLTRDTDNIMARWHITVQHHNATDFEHDSIKLADVELINPVLSDIRGASTIMYATLGEARWWPHNMTPLEHGGQGRGPERCSTCSPSHPFGEYMPPERDDLTALAGRIVKVGVTPVELVDIGE